MSGIRVVLVRPRFPENIGMAARACANMGVSELIVVEPELWDEAKALPLAAGLGKAVLQNMRLAPDLASAIANANIAVATSARTGGWRREILSPPQAAGRINATIRQGGRAALVFGPEDRGLSNTEVALCGHMATIPASPACASLNLAQAVLIMLYECFREAEGAQSSRTRREAGNSRPASRMSTLAEQELLFENLKETLLKIDLLPQDNPDWFIQPLKRFLRRGGLRRHEFDFIMGICRQIKNKL